MTKLALTKQESHDELVSVLKVILDCVDYTEPHGCLLNAPISGILPNQIIMRAKGALERDAELPLERNSATTAAVEEHNYCHADTDGDCAWEQCPQNRDGEPSKSGRHCPLDRKDDEW